jgi:hypothetical protein
MLKYIFEVVVKSVYFLRRLISEDYLILLEGKGNLYGE